MIYYLAYIFIISFSLLECSDELNLKKRKISEPQKNLKNKKRKVEKNYGKFNQDIFGNIFSYLEREDIIQLYKCKQLNEKYKDYIRNCENINLYIGSSIESGKETNSYTSFSNFFLRTIKEKEKKILSIQLPKTINFYFEETNKSDQEQCFKIIGKVINLFKESKHNHSLNFNFNIIEYPEIIKKSIELIEKNENLTIKYLKITNSPLKKEDIKSISNFVIKKDIEHITMSNVSEDFYFPKITSKTIRTINLSKNTFDTNNFYQFCKNLKNFPNIQELNLSRCEIEPDMANKLEKNLPYLKTLKILDVLENNILEVNIITMINSCNKNINEIYLSQEYVEEEYIEYDFKTLEKLTMIGFNIKTDDATTILNKVCGEKLNYLSISLVKNNPNSKLEETNFKNYLNEKFKKLTNENMDISFD